MEGRVLHEPRHDQETKNLLLMRFVGPKQVIEMLKSCSGAGYQSGLHHSISGIETHVMKPTGKYAGWYLKFYFTNPETVFLSVHK